MGKINKFSVDWKFSSEDVIWNAEQVVGKLPIEYLEEREVYGDWFDVVTYNEKEILIAHEPPGHEFVQRVVDVINEYLPNQTKEFQYLDDDGGDNLTFVLVEKAK